MRPVHQYHAFFTVFHMPTAPPLTPVEKENLPSASPIHHLHRNWLASLALHLVHSWRGGDPGGSHLVRGETTARNTAAVGHQSWLSVKTSESWGDSIGRRWRPPQPFLFQFFLFFFFFFTLRRVIVSVGWGVIMAEILSWWTSGSSVR